MARRLPAVCVDSNGICCAVGAEITTIADPSARRPPPIDRVGGRIAGRSPPVAGRTAEALRAVSGQAQVDHQAQRQEASPIHPWRRGYRYRLMSSILISSYISNQGSSQAKLFRRSRSGARIRGPGPVGMHERIGRPAPPRPARAALQTPPSAAPGIRRRPDSRPVTEERVQDRTKEGS